MPFFSKPLARRAKFHRKWSTPELALSLGRPRSSSFVGGVESFSCPSCGGNARRHDARRRSWRHLPTCQYQTIRTADLRRVRCAEHGVRPIGVPWSDPGSRVTALFKALVIDCAEGSNSRASWFGLRPDRTGPD